MFIPELARGNAEMFLDIFPKKGDIREIKLVGDLLDAFFCPEKQEIDIFYDALVN